MNSLLSMNRLHALFCIYLLNSIDIGLKILRNPLFLPIFPKALFVIEELDRSYFIFGRIARISKTCIFLCVYFCTKKSSF